VKPRTPASGDSGSATQAAATTAAPGFRCHLRAAATGRIIAALEAKLTEYPGDEDLANGECWL